MTSGRFHRFFGRFKPHTLLELFILSTYLETWIRKMLLGKSAGNGIFFVDACAGSGSDSVGNSGSPVIAAREAAKAAAQLKRSTAATL